MGRKTYTTSQTIRAGRVARQLTQVQVATALGVTQATVSAWETGAAQPSLDNLVALARLLGATTDDLLGREAA